MPAIFWHPMKNIESWFAIWIRCLQMIWDENCMANERFSAWGYSYPCEKGASRWRYNPKRKKYKPGFERN